MRFFCHNKPNPIFFTLPMHLDQWYFRGGVNSPKSPSLWITMKDLPNSDAKDLKKESLYKGIDGCINKIFNFKVSLSFNSSVICHFLNKVFYYQQNRLERLNK